ncbi:MAG: hypothetical protein LUH22_06175 [Bacteroides sp.]|nr:hypothetical protein [Bacteroides sp.]
MAVAGYSISSADFNLQGEFNSVSNVTDIYGSVYFSYSRPVIQMVVSEDSENIFELRYTNFYGYTLIEAKQDICFIKSDGTILRVRGTEDKTIFTENPRKYTLSFVTPINNPDYGCIFVKNLTEMFNIVITDASGIEYAVTLANGCARYYNVSETPLGSTSVSYNGYSQIAMADPVYVRAASGWVTDGSRGVAVICVPK